MNVLSILTLSFSLAKHAGEQELSSVYFPIRKPCKLSGAQGQPFSQTLGAIVNLNAKF